LPALYLLRANSHCSTRAFVVCGKRFKAGKSVVQAFYGKLFWGAVLGHMAWDRPPFLSVDFWQIFARVSVSLGLGAGIRSMRTDV